MQDTGGHAVLPRVPERSATQRQGAQALSLTEGAWKNLHSPPSKSHLAGNETVWLDLANSAFWNSCYMQCNHL